MNKTKKSREPTSEHAMAMDIPFLGRIPLDPAMVRCADTGQSYLEKYPEAGVTKAYNQIIERIMHREEPKAAVA